MRKKVVNRLLASVLCAAMLITNQDMAYVFAMPEDGQEVYSDTGMEETSGEAQDSEPEISDNVLEKPELPKTNELSDEDGVVLQSETVETVTLNTESLKLTVGEKFDLSVTVLPETMESYSVSWTSSDEKVATVAEGCVTAVEVGECIVTASVGEKTAQCKVTVTDTIPAERILINGPSYELGKGQVYNLEAVVYPSNSTDKITWESSDESIATISDDGVLVAKEIGTCTIMVSAGDKKYSCSYHVGEGGISGNIRWHISFYGELSIEGTGNIETDTETGRMPWYPDRASIKSAVINATEMTDISKFFSGCNNLEEVDASGLDAEKITSATDIFNGCDLLSQIQMPVGLTCDIALPIVSEGDAWYRDDGSQIEKLDMNLEQSIHIAKNKKFVYPYITATATKTAYKRGESISKNDLTVTLHKSLEDKLNISNFYIGEEWYDYSDEFGIGKIAIPIGYNGLSTKVWIKKSSEVAIPLEGLVLSECELTLREGDNVEIAFEYVPEGAIINWDNGTDFKWESSDSSIALGGSSDIDGRTVYIKAVSVGNCTFTLSFGDISTVCNVTVKAKNDGTSGEVASGQDGQIQWSIDANGQLNVEGEGDIRKPVSSTLAYNRAPWSLWRDYIKTAKVAVKGMTDASYLFSRCYELTSIDLTNFETSQITDMYRMFSGCGELTSITWQNLNTSQVTDMAELFRGCSHLTVLDLSQFDTSQVIDMAGMFAGCTRLTELDLGNFNTSKIISMASMFAGCSSLAKLDLSQFDTSQVTNMYMMFGPWEDYGGCNGLRSLDLKNFDTSQVTNMSNMFSGCGGLTTLDLSNFDTSQVTNMGNMFSGCGGLTTLDLSNFDTSKVIDMSYMFDGCSSLASLDLSSFDTSQVTKMANMFYNCGSLTTLNLSNFNTGHVTTMEEMFCGCSNLSVLNLGNFNSDCAPNMSYMFSGCAELADLDLSGIDFMWVTDSDMMLYGCTKLTHIKTPIHVRNTIDLPMDSGDVWYQEDGTEITKLPQYLDYSIEIGRNKIPEVNPVPDTYIVTFDLQGHGNMDAITVASGNQIEKPSDPSAEGYTFTGWYKDAECRMPWDFAADTVTENITLYAGWELIEIVYTVTFDLQGHGNMDGITVVSGNKIEKPSDPAASGYTFTGWYKESACENRWNFAEDVVSGNTVLYAGWKPVEVTYTVSFNLQGYGSMGDTTVVSGNRLEKPVDPAASGHIFTGWYKETDCVNRWNFDTDVVTENITLYAEWEIDEAFDGVFEEDTKYAEKELWAAPVDSYEYTGKAIKPEVRVYYGDRKLDLGLDYTVSYKNNTKAATDSSAKPPTIMVKGKGIYAKEKIDPVRFTIRPVELSSSKISAENIELIANNKVQKKIPVLTYNGKKLANKKDFILPDDYKGYSEGEHDLVLTAKEGGNFTGTRTVHISIRTGISMSRVKIGKIASEKYTGAEITPTPAVTMKGVPLEESNYTFQYLHNVEIGTATIIVTGRGDYVGTKKATFKITGDSLKKATITGIRNGENIYDGSLHRPAVVTLNGITLTENKDYMASYTNNKNAGKAGVTITGIGKYTGTIKKTFKIAAYELEKGDSRIGGLEESIVVPYAGKKGSKPVLHLTFDGKVLREGRDYTLTCKNNKAVTTDDVKKKPTVTIKGKGNFKGKISDVPFIIVE